ncbi:DNA topoisomerase I [Streptococcus pneumoniae GA07643]|nr:hypothetical protein SPG_1158 [Streptococcus pneumoniae G54]ANO37045.1 hypothetical protein SPND219_02310 [Streptococcus pneumoniae]EGJ17181.1 hypothetical protein SPAR120_1228 [Streptococcus pneumoniae GA47901]EHD49876.1 DNA topoisomerase I [Streptococcus pneumoniae GA16531]EHD57869.1 DNA topoisomerase I [Streptococcus pneumoniae GA44500]EHD66735.1 DNA topoisomerase I [Streptococcus pneumoniae 5787-06]EHD84004.1 DNA topoisomerase I [Streptococcus pneumoniae GA07643]EHE25402.1 hypothetica
MAHSKIAKSLLESSNSSYILFLNSINEYSLLFVTNIFLSQLTSR